MRTPVLAILLAVMASAAKDSSSQSRGIAFWSLSYEPWYYQTELDHFVSVSGNIRLAPRWAAEARINGAPLILGVGGDVAVLRYVGRHMRSRGYEDWVALGAGWLFSETVLDGSCADCGDWQGTPLAWAGYGRDMFPFSAASAGFRLALRLGFAAPKSLARDDGTVAGLKRSGHIFLALDAGVLLP